MHAGVKTTSNFVAFTSQGREHCLTLSLWFYPNRSEEEWGETWQEIKIAWTGQMPRFQAFAETMHSRCDSLTVIKISDIQEEFHLVVGAMKMRYCLRGRTAEPWRMPQIPVKEMTSMSCAQAFHIKLSNEPIVSHNEEICSSCRARGSCDVFFLNKPDNWPFCTGWVQRGPEERASIWVMAERDIVCWSRALSMPPVKLETAESCQCNCARKPEADIACFYAVQESWNLASQFEHAYMYSKWRNRFGEKIRKNSFILAHNSFLPGASVRNIVSPNRNCDPSWGLIA